MRRIMVRINAWMKGLVLWMKPHLFLGWLRKPLLMTSNTLSLSRWIAGQEKSGILNDFYTSKRDYLKRYKLYQYIVEDLNLKNGLFDYLEFGVSKGHSFKWWVEQCVNEQNHFYGFDTFEGLPESWGAFSKGDMDANIPDISDPRSEFIKGLFQHTLPDFLSRHDLKRRKVIHMDADLFSSTLFVLTTLAPVLKKDDILIFDEFNVPNHEFLAFKMFCDAYYIRTKLLGAVNNYFQVAMIIE
jgi:O-methyltransferase